MRQRHTRPLEELWKLPSVTVPEAIRMTGYTRRQIDHKRKQGVFREVMEGTQVRIATSSMIQHFKDLGADVPVLEAA